MRWRYTKTSISGLSSRRPRAHSTKDLNLSCEYGQQRLQNRAMFIVRTRRYCLLWRGHIHQQRPSGWRPCCRSGRILVSRLYSTIYETIETREEIGHECHRKTVPCSDRCLHIKSCGISPVSTTPLAPTITHISKVLLRDAAPTMQKVTRGSGVSQLALVLCQCHDFVAMS